MAGPWNLLAPIEVKPLNEIMKEQEKETEMVRMLQETTTFGEEERGVHEQQLQETPASSVAMAAIGDGALHPPLEHVEDQSDGQLLQETSSLGQEEEVQLPEAMAANAIDDEAIDPPSQGPWHVAPVVVRPLKEIMKEQEKETEMARMLQETTTFGEEERGVHEQKLQETPASLVVMDNYDGLHPPLEHVEDQSDELLHENSSSAFGEEGGVQQQQDQEREMEQISVPPRLLSFTEPDNSFLTPWKWKPDQ